MLTVKGQVYLANFVVDMRKNIDGLSALVVNHFSRNPSDGSAYVFMNRARNKIKLLYFDRNGFALWYKRLEQGKFQCPQFDGEVYTLEAAQLHWLLDGLDFMKLQGHPTLSYTEFC
jgi:transposase